MTSYARVPVTCPHCDESFLESARLIRIGGSAWCPACLRLFPLDPMQPKVRIALGRARRARARRREKIAVLRRQWAEPAPDSQPPRAAGDLLRTLDALIARMNELDRPA